MKIHCFLTEEKFSSRDGENGPKFLLNINGIAAFLAGVRSSFRKKNDES